SSDVCSSDLLVPGGGDTDLRFTPVRIVHPHGAQHAASRGGFDAVGDLPGPGLDIHFVGARHAFTIGTSASPPPHSLATQPRHHPAPRHTASPEVARRRRLAVLRE